MQLLPASGNRIDPFGKIVLGFKLGNLPMKHTHNVQTFNQLSGTTTNFQHRFRIGADWDKDGKLFLYHNC